MGWIRTTERTQLEAISQLVHANPFLPERIDAERRALGEDFDEQESVWNIESELDPADSRNLEHLEQRSRQLAAWLRERLVAGAPARDGELRLYEDLIHFLLYHRHRADFDEYIRSRSAGGRRKKAGFYSSFLEEATHYLQIPGVTLPDAFEPDRLFAVYFQVRRAFHHIFAHLIGASAPAQRLRASVWQSIFTRDLRRYRRSLHDRMGDITTLIVGPSGTGKELVARAIGLSRFVPFDAQTRSFREDFLGAFSALNLSELTPTLLESELFGHCRGSFTGAVQDHAGWLEDCPESGAVFLDEIGELDGSIQVKLLRVLQSRTFHRVGESESRRFLGKVIAATNRDLSAEMREGRFREDLYYRLCSDVITTPSLREQLDSTPKELDRLLLHIARGWAGDDSLDLASEVGSWIAEQLPSDYAWPGNFRELEQCVCNVMIRGEYRPAAPPTPTADLGATLRAGTLTADELLRYYCTFVYERTGSYEGAARRLKLDRRTVKAKVDPSLLDELQG